MHTALVTPYGIEPQDVPWLADLIARQAVHLFDARQLQDLTQSVSVGPNCAIHTAQLHQTVFAHGHQSTGTLVAIKQYHRPADLIFEIHQLLITPVSQYTNPLLGVVQLGDQGLTCLVVPYHPLGNLRQYIVDQRANLTALQQLQIVHDITSGLEYLHQRGIQHLNLHSANVLISLQGMALLTDFGRVNNRAEVGMPPKPIPELERIRSLAVVFLAPEVLASNSYSSRSEVYALGMVMFELLTGKVAFEKDLNQPGLATRIMFGRQDEIPANIKGSPGPVYEALIRDCWKLNPAHRPHISELKSRLEQLMADRRLTSDASMKQQQQHQQQPNQQLQSSLTSVKATASNMPAANIITTTVVVPSHSRKGTEGATNTPVPAQQLQQSNSEPLESWTIGQASSPPITQQRDAIPISSRALEISSGKRMNTSGHQSEQLFTVPLNTSSLPTPAPVATTDPPTESHIFAAAANYPSPTNSASTEMHDSVRRSASPVWPMPPIYHHSKQTSPVALATAPEAPARPTANVPSPTSPSYAASSTAASKPTAPLVRHESSEILIRAYAAAPGPSSSTSSFPRHPSISSAGTTATSASTLSEARPPPIPIPSRTTSALYSNSQTGGRASTKSPTSSPSAASMSPDALFNPGRNTIMAGLSVEQKQKDQEPMPTFFKWQQQPIIPVDKEPEVHRIQSVASPVTVVEGPATMAGAAQESAMIGVGGFIATIEPIVPLLTGVVAAQFQEPSLPLHAQHPQSQSPTLKDRQTRESTLIIPVFPEPPATLHNRRISNMDIRFRQAARQYTTSRLQEQPQYSVSASIENNESGSSFKNPIRTSSSISGAIMAPQETPATPMGLVARGTYTPIMSSEDVPIASLSDSIHSAAKNGDLLELQQFLNEALSRSLSNGSTSHGKNNTSHHHPRQGSSSQHRGHIFPSAADILDEFEPIERLPVLCCAAVARKNKYQALNMVLRAGANVEGKEQRGGNTPLHLVCETAPPPDVEALSPSQVKDNGRKRSIDIKMSQLSLLDWEDDREGNVDERRWANDEDGNKDVTEDTEVAQEEALRKADEQDEQEQQALERVKEDSESIFSISANEDGYPSLFVSREQKALSGAYYRMKNQFLIKGGLEDQIRLLVLAGSPVDTPNHRGETPLLLLLRFHDSMTALATLLRLGANPMHMAPFGPGTNPAEIHIDPKTLLTPTTQKRMSKRLLFSTKQIAQQQQQTGDDPNHILVMHGSALAHAAYYLRLNCVRYLLEHEIECSDPTVIEQAIVACQHSIAAKVNPPLVATQNHILKILERDWRGESGRRRRIRVAERALNRKRKPTRSNALLAALAVSSSSSAPSSEVFTFESEDRSRFQPFNDTGAVGRGAEGGEVAATWAKYHGKTPSSSLGPIPTTHLYATDGPMGPGIEVISQHGFVFDDSAPRFQLSDRPMTRKDDGHGGGANLGHSKETQDWRMAHDSKSPRPAGLEGESSGLFKKLRNKARS
ncbi:hypothetical protein BGX28_010331 [Mortierella sp. GBA30]|nr:hypothetical protein BGX28_010331 [Mortierella sp. GBA30]